MKLLLVSSEAAPFAASGGLGDVMGALPEALSKDKNVETIDVILPYYNIIKEEFRQNFEKVIDISFNLAWRSTGASIYRYTQNGVNYLFVENHYYFDRNKLYGEFDDGERFSFFSKAVIEYVVQSGNYPDLIHANDWQSALTVIYLKTVYSSNCFLSAIKTLFTIHNIEYQGKFGLDILCDVFDIHETYKNILEYDGCINLMKGAITVSDYVSTVSPSYANELTDDFYAFGLAKIIESAKNKLSGVINGIDYTAFSPKSKDIYFSYTKNSFIKGKEKNKLCLQRELNLEENVSVPLLSMVTRLTAGKGLDIVLEIIEELLNKRIQLVILGTGEAHYEARLTELSKRYTNLRVLIKFDRILSKKIYASSDMFLMPSKSEPCGLAQMIACSYGTAPIVRSVGGLSDSIIDYGNSKSNGFKFNNFDSNALLTAIDKALCIYNDKALWNPFILQVMSSDFSWKVSAQKYVEIYNNLLN